MIQMMIDLRLSGAQAIFILAIHLISETFIEGYGTYAECE